MRWGSSCAVWKCRAARCAVPTVYAEAPRPFVGAGHWPARHIEDGKAARPGGRALQGRTPVVAGGHMGAAPTAEIRPGALARQSQAHSLNRTSSNFYKPRAQWPGGNLERHSDFARRKFCLDLQVCVPRNGGPGVRRIWTRSVHPEPSPGDSLVTFSSLRKSLAAAAAKFPGATNPRDEARRGVAQASFSCPYGAIHLLAPYEKGIIACRPQAAELPAPKLT